MSADFFAEQYPLAKYTTWHIGGPAKYFYQPHTVDNLINFLKKISPCEKILWLGWGSNVLIGDQGFDGIVISLKSSLNQISLDTNNLVRAEAGVSCAKLIRFSLDHNLIDPIFLAGIPGTIGGALAMNAGAFGDTIWHYVVAVETIDRFGNIRQRSAQEFNFGYRSLEGLEPQEWFLKGYFKFKPGDRETARKKMGEILQKRKTTQPFTEPSCGSVFKNPPGDFAGRLIEACGLKGYQIGGAKVSLKHANFIINTGNATASDVKKLIELIRTKVQTQFGVGLELEVKII